MVIALDPENRFLYFAHAGLLGSRVVIDVTPLDDIPARPPAMTTNHPHPLSKGNPDVDNARA
jgi:hypothetical protein